MTHERAALILTEFVLGKLAWAEEKSLTDHARDCAECREQIGTIRLMLDASESSSTRSDPHPLAADMALFALYPERVPAPKQFLIKTHTDACAACMEEISLTKAHAAGPQAPAVTAPRSLSWWVALAATLALALLLYPAWLGLGRPPEVTSSDWSGAVPLRLLGTTSRSAGTEAVLPLPDGQPFLLLAIVPQIPSTARPDSLISIEITGEDGRSAWRHEVTARRVAEELMASQVLVLAVPATRVPPGRYVLTMIPAEGTGGDTLLTISFRVERAP